MSSGVQAGAPGNGHDPASNGHDPGSGLPLLDPQSAPVLGPSVVRPHSSLWDRSKILLLLAALWWVLLWAAMTNNPIEPFSVASAGQLSSLWWLEVLFGLELLRQGHYLISERSARWHRIGSEAVFGGLHRVAGRMTDWNRFRLARVLKIVVALVVLAVILAAFYHTSPLVSLFQVPAAVYSALPLLIQVLFLFFVVILQFVGLFWFLSKGGIDTYYPGDVKTRFSDVWGQDSVLDRVKENIIFLKDPDLIEARGGYVPGGILLWGPPGTGKTLIAEAVAGETRNPFVFVDPGAFNNMFFGVGILKVKSLFRKLRRLALRYGGVVVFFDEADSLGSRGALSPSGVFGPNYRTSEPWNADACHGCGYVDQGALAQVSGSWRDLLAPRTTDVSQGPRVGPFKMMGMGMGGGGGMGTLQTLLSEISGLKKPRGLVNRVLRRALGVKPAPPPKYRILVMMATNMPESLDEALLRPGRIDRVYKVGYPTKNGRLRTYEGYFAKVTHSLTDANMERLATITPYATGATIKDLVNEALINAIRGGRGVITWEDVVKAKQLKELGPPEDVEYIERERHAVAVHEACHAVTAARIHRDWAIDVATIEKGGTYLGMVKPVKLEDTFTRWKTDFESEIKVFLASLAGERMFFEGDSSSGLGGDLENATRIATFMEGYWGMGSTVANHGVTKEAGIPGGEPDKVDKKNRLLTGGLGGRIEANLERLVAETAQLLEANRLEVFAVAHALEHFKTVTGEDVLAIIDGRQGPFIDGARYHTEEFRQMAEDYHAKIIELHTGRSHEQVELPVLAGVSISAAPEEPELTGAI
ncbi:MAG: AAA family ATPase [Acidimicrobiales bacterium]